MRCSLFRHAFPSRAKVLHDPDMVGRVDAHRGIYKVHACIMQAPHRTQLFAEQVIVLTHRDRNDLQFPQGNAAIERVCVLLQFEPGVAHIATSDGETVI